MTPYDCHFKIADLGLSHFKKHIPGLRTATDKDTFGTRAYGKVKLGQLRFALLC